eukprot:scaffold7634_cov248-Pinguiococcus_pyrenoidosus.AAC.2
MQLRDPAENIAAQHAEHEAQDGVVEVVRRRQQIHVVRRPKLYNHANNAPFLIAEFLATNPRIFDQLTEHF